MSLFVRALSSGCKIEDADAQVSARLDAYGRWCTFRDKEVFYRRAFDGRIVSGANAEYLSEEKYRDIHLQVISWLQKCLINTGLTGNGIVEAGAQLSLADYLNLPSLYKKAYPEPVTILPPDRYQDIVLQPARGCPNRRCNFCAFYKNKPYKVLSNQQLDQHFMVIKRLLGGDFSGRNGVFLGSANALINKQIGSLKRGVASFADPDFAAPRTEHDWAELAYLNLKQVVIGLETGWSELRFRLGKSGDLSKTENQIKQLHRAGISVGLTLLNGACEEEYQLKNLSETMAFIEVLNLRQDDLVYLSPLSKEGVVSSLATQEQALFKEALKKVTGARIVPYQMQRFNYYT